MSDHENPFLKHFKDPAAVARYTEGPKHFTPGLEDVYRMTGILLAERVPDNAHILVLGAGGGLELTALASAYPGWRFTGVDPAAEMLTLAEQTMGEDAHRAELVEGYIDDAPAGPFDGAVCLLTLHFLDETERIRTASEIHKRLRPEAPFVAVHSSFPQAPGERDVWLSRYRDFAISRGFDAELAENARKSVSSALDLFDPEKDAQILSRAGFQNVSQFYRAFTWAGWVGYA